MEIRTNLDGSRLEVSLSGRLDSANAPELEAAMKDALHGVTELVFDVQALRYISSAGLRVLLVSQKAMNQQGRVTVRGASQPIREVFDLTGFSDIITVE